MTHVFECSVCGRHTFYEKKHCHACGNDEFGERDPGTGELLSVTRVHVTPDGVREPNSLGLVRFENGANLIAQLGGDLAVGDTVTLDADCQLRQDQTGIHTGPRVVAVKE